MSPKKLASIAAAVFVAALVGWLIHLAYEDGSRADDCAAALEGAAKAQDRLFLETAIPSPSVRERIEKAAKVELVYVRPGPDGARVGYALSRTQTATKAQLLRLTLDAGEGCRFLQDEEGGAFTR